MAAAELVRLSCSLGDNDIGTSSQPARSQGHGNEFQIPTAMTAQEASALQLGKRKDRRFLDPVAAVENKRLLCDGCVSLAVCVVTYALQTSLFELQGEKIIAELSAFREDATAILCSECASLSVLDLPGLRRLCEILGIPERCAHIWLPRFDNLRRWLGEQRHVEEPQFEAVGQAWQAFSKWLSEKGSSKLDQCFVRQTICCATTLLRRIFREASASASDPKGKLDPSIENQLVNFMEAIMGGT